MTSWRMQPTAVSALGVIAIVSVMITLTASESESGILEQSSRSLGQEVEKPTIKEETTPKSNAEGNTSSSINTGIILSGKENTSIRDEIRVDTDHQDSMNLTNSKTDAEIVEVQRDQSDDGVVNDRHNSESKSVHPESKKTKEEEEDEEKEEEEVDSGRNKGKENTKSTEAYIEVVGDSSASGVSRRMDARENQALVGSRKKSGQLDSVQGEIEGLSLSISRLEEPVSSGTSEESIGNLSADSAGHSNEPAITLAGEVRSIEQKNVEDIKAISFQVPVLQVALAASTHEEPMKPNEEAASMAKSDTRKEQSRTLNNILVSGKSTKAFYEIKPSIKTEMEGQERQVTLSSQSSHQRKFVLPSVDSAIGKYGPYFEDGDQEMNITARIGSTVLLDCKIGMLGDKKVTWLQHSKDSFRLLTVGRTPYSNDQRISLNFRYPSNWRLQILFAAPRDSGLYKCQVATHPPLIKEINVIVTAPELTITDDSGRLVSKERHLKAGSALKLRCEARDVIEALEESVIWTRGDETLTEDVSENRTTETLGDKEVLIIISTLTVERATPRHAGNYSCVVPGKAKTSIAVHVLNGELPAAVHDVNGVSRAFLNLWLIHLTMSYVFSR